MKLSLSQSEIEHAVRVYMGTLLNVAPGVTFNIDFAATRGPEGFTANIDMVSPEPKAETVDEPIPAQAVNRAKPKSTPTLTKAAEKPADEPEEKVATTAQAKVEEKQADASSAASVDVKEPVQEKEAVQTGEQAQAAGGFPGFAAEPDANLAADKDADQPAADAAGSDELEPAGESQAAEQKAAEPPKKPSLFANLRQAG